MYQTSRLCTLMFLFAIENSQSDTRCRCWLVLKRSSQAGKSGMRKAQLRR
jgi:hypothetical protein